MGFRKRIVAILAFLCLSPAFGRTVYDFPSLQADLGFTPPKDTAFDLTVKVVFPCTKAAKRFFVTDGTNIFYLVDEVHWPNLAFAANDIIHVQGRIRQKGNPDCLKIEVIGKGSPEPVTDTSIAELTHGNARKRLVRVRGKIRTIFRDEIDPDWVFATLYDGGNALRLEFMPTEEEFRELRKLIDTEVRVIGIPYTTGFVKKGNRRFAPATLSVRSLANFQIIRPAPEDPFTEPELNMPEFVRMGLHGNQRRSVVGHVLAAYAGNRLVMRTDAGETVNVELSDNAAPAFGTRIRVVGYPATDLYHVNLTDAIWREETGVPFAGEPAENVSLDNLLMNENGLPMIKVGYHGRFIRIRGTIRALPGPGNAEKRLIIESGLSNIPADVSACPQLLGDIGLGCEVEISGTCVMPTPNWHRDDPPPRIREVFIVLRSSADLKILRRPPWWTAERLLLSLGVLLALIVWFAVWNLVLRRAVDRRGKELESEITAHVESDLKVYERTRLAVELHDSIAQNLTGATMEIRTADILADSDPVAMHKYLSLASKTLDSCREDLRNCIWDLRNLTLDETSVDEAIRKTLEPHAAGVNLQIRFSILRERLTDNTTHAILRIIRELVLNAIRHGKATRIRIAGSVENGKLLFSVKDDGCGFDPEKAPGMNEGHFGLQGIRDRIKNFGGDVKISSKPGHGAKVTVSLNIPNSSEKQA